MKSIFGTIARRTSYPTIRLMAVVHTPGPFEPIARIRTDSNVPGVCPAIWNLLALLIDA